MTQLQKKLVLPDDWRGGRITFLGKKGEREGVKDTNYGRKDFNMSLITPAWPGVRGSQSRN